MPVNNPITNRQQLMVSRAFNKSKTAKEASALDLRTVDEMLAMSALLSNHGN
jgi:hypothetical protein